ncbi:putative uncharacterized protein DDB_G0290521 [Haliotis rubra]|uniref:putative uncharacterized protein DDB_G0290521 n=1 Tax=Haliotis rubra TaxID=36100 RepID=UPI001EE52AE0|nr:putative uncharacterized protein DDB_G0290521 [Haliotis rubra]
MVLVDLLTSPETCFLLYFLRYLKCLVCEWDKFVTACHLRFCVSQNEPMDLELSGQTASRVSDHPEQEVCDNVPVEHSQLIEDRCKCLQKSVKTDHPDGRDGECRSSDSSQISSGAMTSPHTQPFPTQSSTPQPFPTQSSNLQPFPTQSTTPQPFPIQSSTAQPSQTQSTTPQQSSNPLSSTSQPFATQSNPQPVPTQSSSPKPSQTQSSTAQQSQARGHCSGLSYLAAYCDDDDDDGGSDGDIRSSATTLTDGVVLTPGTVPSTVQLSARSCDLQCVESVMSELIRVGLRIERLSSQDLFPYNPGPLLSLLEQCELLYDGMETDKHVQ